MDGDDGTGTAAAAQIGVSFSCSSSADRSCAICMHKMHFYPLGDCRSMSVWTRCRPERARKRKTAARGRNRTHPTLISFHHPRFFRLSAAFFFRCPVGAAGPSRRRRQSKYIFSSFIRIQHPFARADFISHIFRNYFFPHFLRSSFCARTRLPRAASIFFGQTENARIFSFGRSTSAR